MLYVIIEMPSSCDNITPGDSCYPNNDIMREVPTDSFFTTTTPNAANPVAKYLKPKDTFPCTDPCLVEDWECYRSVHDYVVKKKQYLESSGKIYIFEPSGLILDSVIVSGPTIVKDITNNFKQMLKLQFPEINYDCPILGFEFDTGKINLFSGCDIEPGFRKIIQFTYTTEDMVYQQKKLRHVGLMDSTYERSFDPTSCDILGNPTVPNNMPSWDAVKSSATYKINEGRCCKNE
jgi:hypothetical protein